MKDIELSNDHFQNYKVYGIPKAQLGRKAYGFEIKKKFFADANKLVLSQVQQTLFQ